MGLGVGLRGRPGGIVPNVIFISAAFTRLARKGLLDQPVYGWVSEALVVMIKLATTNIAPLFVCGIFFLGISYAQNTTLLLPISS